MSKLKAKNLIELARECPTAFLGRNTFLWRDSDTYINAPTPSIADSHSSKALVTVNHNERCQSNLQPKPPFSEVLPPTATIQTA